MQWVLENWLLIVVGGGMGAMHVFGHSHGNKTGRRHALHSIAKRGETPELEPNGRSRGGTNV